MELQTQERQRLQDMAQDRGVYNRNINATSSYRDTSDLFQLPSILNENRII